MSRLFSDHARGSAAISAAQLTAALISGTLGLLLLIAVGFAQVSHEAAHDSRHSLAFPCH